MRMYPLLILVMLCHISIVQAQSVRNSTTLALAFRWQNHYAQPVFDRPVFTNVHGQAYSITTLRYYLHDITLHREDEGTFVRKAPCLIDHGDDTSTVITLESVPVGTYSSISFVVGVDSIDNVAGPQEGVLDPLNGMYWTWATGYIFFKLEGTSPASSQPKNLLEFHLGGFQAPYKNMQRIELPLRRPLIVDTSAASLEIVFDVGAFIDADGGIDFSAVSSVTDTRAATPYMKRMQGAFYVR